MNDLKISIVTPCYNSAAFIGETIDSISGQGYRNFEHIVVDGASKDGTADILRRHGHLKWISEKDKGQSDAINKGFRMATGDILAWQNADDVYLPGAFESVARFFSERPEVDFVYGDYQHMDTGGKWICDIRPPEWNRWLFSHGRFVPPQPTCFWRRRVWEGVGELDLGLHYCMDVDFYCRAQKSFRFAKKPGMMGKFRVHVDSKTQNSANQRKVYREHRQVLARNFGYGPMDYLLFDAFYYRSRLAAVVKARWLKRW